MSAAWLLTVGGVSGPGVEPSCLGTLGINDETAAAFGDDTVDASVLGNTLVGSPTTGATLGGKMLESMELLNNNQLMKFQLLTLYCYQSLNPYRSTMAPWARTT